MANLRIGSASDKVKQVQEKLGFTGSDLDGIYGPKTEAAVIDFQRKNGAQVDGIVGDETWGLMFGGNSGASGSSDSNVTTPTTPQTGTLGENPGDWWKHYNEKAQGYMGQIESREPFSFDVNSDPLYDQLKDQYIQQGQLAMMDTMGQAAAMTGGYGNSYAQTVGQQVYNQQLGQLNQIVPELYGQAYDQYQREGQDLYGKYELYAGARDAVKADMTGEKGDLINLIAATGYKPTDAELQAAGMTRGQADSYATAYSTSSKDTGWQHVASVSDAEIVNNLADFKKKGDNVGLDAYLTMLENSKRIDQAMSDELYAAYVTEDDNKGVDTTVGIIPNYDQKWLKDPKLR